jgi:hypothetical protein
MKSRKELRKKLVKATPYLVMASTLIGVLEVKATPNGPL